MADDGDKLTAQDLAIMRGEAELPEVETAETQVETEEKPVPEKPAAKEAEPEADEPDEAESETDEGDDQQSRPRTVPYAALREERKNSHELREQLRRATESLAAMQDRMLAFQEQISSGQVPAKPAAQQPTVETDPIAVLKQTHEAIQSIKTSQAQQAEMAALSETLAAQEYAFAEKNPDYWQAKAYLRENRMQDYIDAGLPAHVAKQRTAQDEAILVKQFLAQNANPAEKFAAMAKRRGYVLKSPEPTPEERAAAEAKKKAAEAEKIETAEKGQNGGKTLSKAAGGGSDEELTPAALAEMSESEFSKYRGKWRRVMGERD